MATEIAYLIKQRGRRHSKRGGFRYYARHQRANGRWTNESLRTGIKAVARLRFEEFKQKLIRGRQHELDHVAPVALPRLVELHLANAKDNQAESWLVKQDQYLDAFKKYFAGDPLSTDITWRQIQDFRNC